MVNKAQSLPAPKALRVQWSYMNTPGPQTKLRSAAAQRLAASASDLGCPLQAVCAQRPAHLERVQSLPEGRHVSARHLQALLASSPREALLLRSGSSTARGFSFSD